MTGHGFSHRKTAHRQKVSWDEHWLEVDERVDDHELMIASGCCGHVCPSRFAPQIPVTSASNSKAVALHHHVTTNSGRRVSVQITFDVMSVRRPLLIITSALKRRGKSIFGGGRGGELLCIFWMAGSPCQCGRGRAGVFALGSDRLVAVFRGAQ